MVENNGVELLGLRMNPGDHVAAFYRTPAERDGIILPFLTDGLKGGDKCTCVVDSCPPSYVTEKLSESLDVESYVSAGQLEVLDSYGTYTAGGGFRPSRMLTFWETRARLGKQAYAFTRNVGEMSWAHPNCPGIADVAGYESELNRMISNYPQVNLCLYDLSKCTGELIFDVLKTHPKALMGTMVIDNPYYLDPDEFLASRRP